MMKTRLTPKHLQLTSLIITAVSLAVSANQPVKAGAPLFGADKTTAVVAKKGKSFLRSPVVSPPEAGVQLLMGILQRIGNEPQIALKKTQSQLRQDDGPSNQMFMASNATDPVLAIRPQMQQQAQNTVAGRLKPSKPTSSEQLIAMMPQKRSRAGYIANEREYDSGSKNLQEAGARNSAYGGFAATGSNGPPAGSTASSSFSRAPESKAEGSSVQNWDKLSKSINKLYQATRFVEEITANKAADADSPASDDLANTIADSESKVIRTGSYNRGTNISSNPKIVEFGGKDATLAYAKPAAGAVISDRRTAGAPAEAFDLKRSERDSLGDSGKTYMKLDNPGAYKYTKEMSNAEQEPLDISAHFGKEKAKKSSPLSANGIHVAYLPPQLVSGIPGIRLGVSEDQVDAYLKGKGKVNRQKFNGWKVWSLTSERTDKTLLQVYLRNGIVEAFRIFDQSYIPEGLGVALNDKLPSMKKKFGEAQFILDEPTSPGGVSIARKNYVYPVNQVSFQLARSSPKEPPTVQSLLLFQFL